MDDRPPKEKAEEIGQIIKHLLARPLEIALGIFLAIMMISFFINYF